MTDTTDETAGAPRAGLRRRSVLTAAGLSAGLAALASAGTPGTAFADTPSDGPVAVPATADLPLVGGDQFPIGVFWPPPPTQVTLERYQEMADAGFTFVINGNYNWDATGIRYALGLAEQVGLKVLVTGDPLETALTSNFWAAGDPTGNRPQLSVQDATVALRAIVNTYKAYSSFAGLDLVDEPAANRFGSLASLVRIVRQIEPGALPYINFRRIGQPYGAWGTAGMDTATYRGYIQQAVDTITPSLLSYDRYPLNDDGTDDPDYFQNWAVVREAGLRAGVPTWIYIQSVLYGGHRLPTASELAWQVNISLAYGAKGIQYFTYWTPDPSRGSAFQPSQGLITVAGHRTSLYGAAKALNNRWLQPAGRVLKPLVSQSVVHAGDDPLPAGATPFAPDDLLTAASGDTVVIGTFAAGEEGGDPTRWLLIANRSHSVRAAARLLVRADRVAAVHRFDPATSTFVAQRNPAELRPALAPGAAALYRLTAG